MKKRDDIYISQIQERIDLIAKHLKGVSQAKFMKSELHQAAVIRELEVIGEASRFVSDETKAKFTAIPWREIAGMRNRLIHEYFDVDHSIVWEVAHTQLPALKEEFEQVFLDTAPPSHPWRNCPTGYHYVHEYDRHVHLSLKNPDGTTSVRAHCRSNPSKKDQLYPDEILLISSSHKQEKIISGSIGKLKDPPNVNDLDDLIVLWTQYWNDIFDPSDKLQPNFMKAMLFSESSFRMNIDDVKVSSRNYARGPMQITDETRKVLTDEKGELKDHFMTLSSADVRKPEIAIAAATRWLFHKRDLASHSLKRQATWEEAVAHYKGYLKKGRVLRDGKGMKNFFSALAQLNSGVAK